MRRRYRGAVPDDAPADDAPLDDAPPPGSAAPPAGAAVVELPTRHGLALGHVHVAAGARGVLALGHGAGGGVGAPDLVGVTAAAVVAGWSVVLVEQPYRVAGKRVPPRPAVLDEAWCDVVRLLRELGAGGLAAGPESVPLVTGGRSAGARVACRTASATGGVGVVALAFPTQPPGRTDRPSRVPELDGAGVPVLVVQGATDPYGVPPAGPGRDIVVVPGDHGLKKDVGAVAAAVVDWLAARAG